MKQLHSKHSQQQQWRSAAPTLKAGERINALLHRDYCVLFTRSNEFTHKRPENFRMQKQ